MLGVSSAGTETLKNLVLPGAGSFVIVDDAKVTARDTGNDFFVTQESIGEVKAKVVCEMMKEMNPDVKEGNFVEASPAKFIEENAQSILEAKLVIACDIGDGLAAKLSSICYSKNIPIVLIRQYGMLGYIRLCKQANCIVEPKVFMIKPKDLRIHDPFPELQQLADSIDLASVEEIVHQHVPYALLLIKARQKFMAENNGNPPKAFAEKKKFREETIKSLQSYPSGLNFDEAIANAQLAFQTNELDFELQNAMSQAQVEDASSATPFWIMMKALKDFHAKEGRLPLSGVVPDMVSTTELFLDI